MSGLPDKIRITGVWNERGGDWQIAIGDGEQTIAYARVIGSTGDSTSHAKAMAIAERICEGWNA